MLPTTVRSALLIVVAALVALSAPAGAVPSMAKKGLHTEAEYRILVIKGKEPARDVDALVATPDAYRIVVWQCLPEFTKESDTTRVMEWVRNGGTLWFQDCRLAPYFGMEADPLLKAELKGLKEHKGEYGGNKKQKGAATFAIAPPGRHEVLQGVDAVQVYLLLVGDDLYSAVHFTDDMTPLLKVELVKGQPLYDKIVAGMIFPGKGRVIFKPLVFSEQFTGDRFQINLLEWSAGFGVPNFASPSGQKDGPAPATPVSSTTTTDRIECADNTVVDGTIVNKFFKLVLYEPELSTGDIATTAAAVIRIRIDGFRDQVELRDGRKMVGSVQFPDDLQVKDAQGKVRKFRKLEISRITFGPLPGAPAPSPAPQTSPSPDGKAPSDK